MPRRVRRHRSTPLLRAPLLRGVVFAILALGLGVAASSAQAQPVTDDDVHTPTDECAGCSDRPIALDEIDGGMLLQRSGAGLIPLPMASIDIDLQVDGIMLTGRVKQTFSNPRDEVIEAVYVFPLPERAAVHEMVLQIGSRRIVSHIEEKKQARRTYEKAKSEGKKAALMEQRRPNLFEISAANINPGEAIEVELTMVQEVDFHNGRFEFVFPMTYTERYGGAVDAPAVLDASFDSSLGPTRLRRRNDPALQASRPSVTVAARIDAGLPLEDVKSDSHVLDVTWDGDTWVLTPEGQTVAPDRDFHVSWWPKIGEQPEAAVVTQVVDGEPYALLMIFPPDTSQIAGPSGLRTDTVFVIDTSGSMQGDSIVQAREALTRAIDRLEPGDRFNIVAFDSVNELFADSLQRADEDVLQRARSFVSGLRADGGTNIVPALEAAMAMMHDDVRTDGAVRRVVFLTDGAVGNEHAVLTRIRAQLADLRVHTIGIGPAPNRYLMRKMAEHGRGLCTFVRQESAAAAGIDAFFARVNRPVLRDVKLNWAGAHPIETYPATIPDLHEGEPMFVSARFARDAQLTAGTFTMTASTAGGPISRAVQVTQLEAPSASAIAIRWARAKVTGLIDSLVEGIDEAKVRERVVTLAKRFHLVTRYTSLVAVEEFASAQGDSRQARVPGTRLGALPRGGTSGPLLRLIGFLLAAFGLTAVLFPLLRRPGPQRSK